MRFFGRRTSVIEVLVVVTIFVVLVTTIASILEKPCKVPGPKVLSYHQKIGDRMYPVYETKCLEREP